MPKVTVSSDVFLNAYDHISESARHEPVSITSPGREPLVLLSAKEYRRLKQNDREALHPWELDESDLQALTASEAPAAAAQFDHELPPA